MQFDTALKALLLEETGSVLGEGAPDREIAVIARLRDPQRAVPGLRVVARFGPVVTGRVPMSQLVAVRRHPTVASLKHSRRYRPTLVRSVPAAGAAPAELRFATDMSDLDGRGTVLGVIDWGVDVAHANFRDSCGRTRLWRLWDQRGGVHRSSPAPFGYGRVFTREQIDDALATGEVYDALGYDPQDADPGRVGAHGTCVLDIAGGTGRAPGAVAGVAPGARLVFVHLKADDTRPEDTLGDSVRVLEAIRYIADVADALDKPVVINCSFGRTGGPHDQSPLVTQGVDALLAERPGRQVVFSAGNYFDSHLHTAGRIRGGETLDVPWLLLEREHGVAEIELWYSGGDRLSAELLDPAGVRVAAVTLGEDTVARDGHGVLAAVFHRRRDPNNGDNVINALVQPRAGAGSWTLRLHGESVRDGAWHAWIERTAARAQSRFPADMANNATTIGTIAAGERSVAVAAVDIDHHRPASFSSAGPTRDGRAKPDVAAPGTAIRAAKSSVRCGTGRTADQLTVKSGTSMATPHVAGTIALMFQAAAPYRLSAEETVRILRRTALRDPAASQQELVRYGAGRINAAAACRAARALSPGGAGTTEDITDVDPAPDSIDGKAATPSDEPSPPQQSEAVRLGPVRLPATRLAVRRAPARPPGARASGPGSGAAGSAQPPASVAPAQPPASGTPAQPSSPSQPSTSLDQLRQLDPVPPLDPAAEPTQPAIPAEPARSTDPVAAEPAPPAEPVATAQPAPPAPPARPAPPAATVEPALPPDQLVPLEPWTPLEPVVAARATTPPEPVPAAQPATATATEAALKEGSEVSPDLPPRVLAEEQPMVPDWPGASADELDFMRRVFAAHVAWATSRGTYVADVAASDLAQVEGAQLRTAAAADANAMLAAARADLAAQRAAGDAKAIAVSRIFVVSGYRSASRQFGLWERGFPDYYRETAESRAALPGGPHGEAAVQLQVRHIRNWLAAPGYSRHNNGRAIDLGVIAGGVTLTASRKQVVQWRRSWFFGWLLANSTRFHFHQNTHINEPWHYEHRPGQVTKAASPASTEQTIEGYLYQGSGTTCGRGPQPGARALADELKARFGGGRAGIYNCRSKVGAAGLSLHGEGRAVDFYRNAFDPAEAANAQQILDWLLAPDAQGNQHALARRIGIQEIIWNRRIWSARRHAEGWRPYRGGGRNPHTDHIHIGMNWPGARMETSYWRARTAGTDGVSPASPDPIQPT